MSYKRRKPSDLVKWPHGDKSSGHRSVKRRREQDTKPTPGGPLVNKPERQTAAD